MLLRSCSFSKVLERDENIQMMKVASSIATGNTRNNLVFPEKSLIFPRFSTSSRASEATK
uniref:Uncharacterized protein n=1 Tax=Arundo donax TaxID=35708 RepID=A0A0A9AGA1_ARUDO